LTEKKSDTPEFMTAQLYAQKFLSYLIAYISSYILYLTIIFEAHQNESKLFLHRIIFPCFNTPFYTFLAFPFLVFLVVFGFYTYRTFIEMYAIEKEIGTIANVEKMADSNIRYWKPFYEITKYLTVPIEKCSKWEGRKIVNWLFLIVIFLSILFASMLVNFCVWKFLVPLFCILLVHDFCLTSKKKDGI